MDRRALHLILLTFFLTGLPCCKSKDPMEHPYTNKLIHESSPYLLQHAHNPVEWYPWGEEALEKAKRENKMLLISIGYSSCHWCHVMERESFEDTTVARIMNRFFVNIKVDREERPDLDDVYMTACQLSSGGNCGWPLNSFVLPDGRPVWAGTYFPKGKWIEILDYFRKAWADEDDKMEDYANRLMAGVRDHGLDSLLQDETAPFTDADVQTLTRQLKDRVDPGMGGRRGAPKFPMPNNWQFLMHYTSRYGDSTARALLMTTLDRMMMGGIYDQLEGGFARYSTDSLWLVPHFEKMLYDNGQLVSLYAQAYAYTGRKDYLDVVNQTLEFVDRHWSDPAGGFYSSFDADSEGKEGQYYVWTTEELEHIIPAGLDRDLFYDYNDIQPSGNWEEGLNILQRHRRKEDIAAQYKITVEDFDASISKTHAALLDRRNARIAPGLDDKVLTSWNGLMIQGYTDAYRASGNTEYLKRAQKAANFILRDMMQEDYRLLRNYKQGKSTINGFLDDYATVIQALLSLYQCTFDVNWLTQAQGLTDHVFAHFDGDPSGFLYYTSDLDPPLVARRIDYSDNVIPSANSIMARNMVLLGELTGEAKYSDRGKSMFERIWPRLKKDGQPLFYSNWCQLLLTLVKPPYEIAVVGEGCKEAQDALLKYYLPDAVLLGGKEEGTLPLLQHKLSEGETLIYVCQNKTCKRPVHDWPEALNQMKE